MSEEFVARAYDRAARRYDEARLVSNAELEQLATFAGRLDRGATVLDVGCGSGVIAARLEAMGHRVVGIDISSSMLREASATVGSASLARMSMTSLAFGAGSFGGLWSSYAVFHVPRQQHAEVFREFRRVLRPSSPLTVSVGVSEWEGSESFHGVDMYWSHFEADESARLLEEAGFMIEATAVLGKGSAEEHYWIQATRGAAT